MNHMKNICVILNAFCLNFGLYAQPFGEAAMNFRIIRLDYENKSGEIAKTYFKYDKNGILSEAFWVLDDQSRSSTNLYEYDSNGRLIAAYRDFSDGLTSFELFSYDSLGNKISERFCRSDSVSGFATYEYKNNYIQQADLKNHKGWLNGKLVYRYDNQKKKESARLMNNDKTICLISFEYDENQNLSKECWDFQGNWSQTFIYHYERKDLKRNYYSSPFLTTKGVYRICRENYTYNLENGGPSFYHYNEEGLLVKKIFVRSDSMITTTSYEYDPRRKLMASKRNYSDGTSARFSYLYDENENLVLREYFRGDTLAGFESYLYNSEGDIIKAYVKNLDDWLTGMIDYHHNELGITTGGEFKGENGFDALISFNYNDDGLLFEIIWEFTFGKFQKYTFEYEMKDSLSNELKVISL